MKKRLASVMAFAIITLLSFSPALVDAAESANQDMDSQTYKKAYTLIMEEKWDEALNELNAFITTYSGSPWMDDALYEMPDSGKARAATRNRV